MIFSLTSILTNITKEHLNTHKTLENYIDCKCELFRNTMCVDSMEAITWGELISFGTNKHPPLSGWLADGFYRLFFQHDFAIHLLGILCIAIGLIYIYKLANYFLDTKKAVCAALIITASSYYSYLIFYYNFNCNILAMGLWPVLAYYFYKSIKFDKLKYISLINIAKGRALGWSTEAKVYDEQPLGFKQSWTQRTRWSVGHIQCFKYYVKDLAAGVVKNRKIMILIRNKIN